MKMEKLDSLLELAMLLGQQNDFQEILRLTMKKVVSLCNTDFALIMMINPQTRNTAGYTLYDQARHHPPRADQRVKQNRYR